MSSPQNEQSSLLPPQSEQNGSYGTTADAEERAHPPQETSDLETPKSTTQLLFIFSGLFISGLFFAIDLTLVATIASPISASLSSLSLLSWLASSFFIATTASQPLAGRLTDIFGRRAGMMTCLLLFAIGNILCAMAYKPWVIILGRVVAGWGGGSVGPIATFVVADVVPLRSRGVWIGAMNICFGIGSSLGGPLGGWFNDVLDWRWAFWVQIPPTALAAALVYFFMNLPVPTSGAKITNGAATQADANEARQSAFKRIDFTGALLIVTTVILLLFSLNVGGTSFPWTHALVLAPFFLSVATLYLFYRTELRAKEPIIPVLLLRNRTIVCALLTNWFITLARFGFFFYAPIFFLVQGYSTVKAGLPFIGEAVAVSTVSICTGLVVRATGRYYVANLVLGLVFVAAFIILVNWVRETPIWVPFITFFLEGAGFVGMLQTTLLAMTGAVEQKEQAVMTSTNYVFRSTGSALSVTIASAVFQGLLSSRLRSVFPSHPSSQTCHSILKDSTCSLSDSPPSFSNLSLTSNLTTNCTQQDLISHSKFSIQTALCLPSPWKGPVTGAYLSAQNGVFWMLLGFAIVGLVLSLGMSEVRLYKTMGRSDQADGSGENGERRESSE